MKKINDIKKDTGEYALKSNDKLKDLAEKQIRKVFVTCLNCIEMRFGKHFEGYEEIRANILRVGNDAVRDLRSKISEDFNIEAIPDKITVYFKGKDEGKEDK